MPSKTLHRLHQMDYYIRNANTGNPKDFSAKLRVCERQVHRDIALLKKLGAPIDFCNKRKTYYYQKEGRFSFKFEMFDYPSQIDKISTPLED